MSAISLTCTLLLQILRIHCNMSISALEIVISVLTHLTVSYLGIHMMGKITDYKRTGYKHMIYMFIVGEQAALMLQITLHNF